MPKHRMHRGLVALSASAVAAIYLAGYTRTQPADAIIDATPTLIALATATPLPTASPVISRPRTAPTAPTVLTVPTATQAPSASTAAYKDGTYSGQGQSRRGNVWVSVTIQGGHIDAVSITRSTLQYPVRDIAGLPGQVVQRQSGQVDIVSGATYSSQAFRSAVSQALSQAA
jgi:uncharacterized protein with FMN-binding domain